MLRGTASGAGDLGAIDAKYDVAVSTAAPALDYMVVDDTPTAQVSRPGAPSHEVLDLSLAACRGAKHRQSLQR